MKSIPWRRGRLRRDSEPVNRSRASAQTVEASRIKAQCAAVAPAAAGTCKAAWARRGGMSGRAGMAHGSQAPGAGEPPPEVSCWKARPSSTKASPCSAVFMCLSMAMRPIAAEAGLNEQLITRYFGGKAGLLLELRRRHDDERGRVAARLRVLQGHAFSAHRSCRDHARDRWR